MRPNKTRRALGAAALALLALGGCAAGTPSGARHKVAIVAKSTTTEFWLSVFAGAEAAATEYNLELTVAGPETEEDWYSQNRMVAEAVEDGAEALVFSAIDYESNAEAIDEAAARGVRIVAIDSPVNAAGQMAARAALDGVEGELRVGIVNYDARSANGQERERGALDAFADSGRARVESVINTLAEAGRAQTDAAALLSAHPGINVLLAFNEPTSVGAAAAIDALGLAEGVYLVGFDSNIATVEGLQTGTVDALVVQNPYAMGYLGVESAYRLLTGQGGRVEETVDTTTRVVDPENMFTLDSQKALFAFQ